MAYNFALNRIRKQTKSSYKKIKAGAVDYAGKPIPKSKQAWHSGRLAGLKVAKSSYYAGQKAGYSKGRKQGFKSGRNYGRMTRGFVRAY